MKIQAAGITAEYNPFHNGHLWQLQALRRILGDVPVIVCMSGWFVQRGEPALADPWTRAEAAVRSGADLVLLLPSLYSLRSADFFAEGAVKLLAATGLIGTLVCSTEVGTSSGAAKNPHDSPVSDSVQTCKEESLPTGKTLSASRTSLAETAAWALQESTVQQ
ncbi:MAG: nucleotidyltransferase family protein, partial [Acidaminococcaceae bacterium]|nr:nucleotidyltransferase family protein [Acidaminococcaceae bacterium]